MGKNNIALIGFRATGKSLVGALLAQQLGWRCVDMDTLLTASFAMDIDRWVRLHGWQAFREAESRLLDDLAGREKLVVATGGGVVLSARNRELLRNRFWVVWLEASPETIYLRLTRDEKTAATRPPLTELPLREEIEQLLAERVPLYEMINDLRLDTDGVSAEQLSSEIYAQLCARRSPPRPQS